MQLQKSMRKGKEWSDKERKTPGGDKSKVKTRTTSRFILTLEDMNTNT